jgi:hypothetical protein
MIVCLINVKLIHQNFIFSKEYDVIFCLNTLHFTDYNNLIKKIKKNTSKKGINVIKVFTKNDPLSEKTNCFEIGELKKYYSDWDIVYYKEYWGKYEVHKSNPIKHKHHFAEIVAVKG